MPCKNRFQRIIRPEMFLKYIKQLIRAFCMILICCCSADTAWGELQLTGLEQSWISDHPVVHLGFGDGKEPYLTQSPDGSQQGLYPEIFAELTAILGIEFKIEVYPWKTMARRARIRKLDGLVVCTEPLAQACGLLQADPLHSVLPAFFVAENSGVSAESFDDLRGKRVVYQQGVALFRQILAPYDGEFTPIETIKSVDAMRMVLEGRADVMVGFGAESYQIAKYGLNGLRLSYLDVDHETPVATAVRSDWPQLQSILNKGFAEMGDGRIQEMLYRWSLYSPRSKKIFITRKEQMWLDAHPSITVMTDEHGAPFSYENERGEFYGILIDIFKQVEQITGLSISYESASYEELGQHVQRANRPFVAGFDPVDYGAYTNEYEKSSDITYMPFGIFARGDRPAVTPDKMSGKKVAIVRGWDRNHPALNSLGLVEFIETANSLESINLLLDGRVDAVFDVVPLIKFKLNHLNVDGIELVHVSPFGMPLTVLIRNDMLEFHSIVEKVLTLNTREKRVAMLNKWRIDVDGPRYQLLTVDLTEEERQWLVENPEVVAGFDPNRKPISWLDEDHEYRGLAADYLKVVEEYLGITFIPVKNGMGLEVMPDVKEGTMALLSSTTITSERKKFLYFTPPYLSIDMELYVRNDSDAIHDLSSLNGKRLAVVEGSELSESLPKEYPQIKLVAVRCLADAVKALQSGSVDAMGGDRISIGHLLSMEGIQSIKKGGHTPYHHDLAFAVQKNQPIWASILTKALRAIPRETREAIYKRWAPLPTPAVDYSFVWKSTLPLVMVMMGFWAWNGLLKRQVRIRTTDLLSERARLREAESIAELGHWETNAKSGRMEWSDQIYHILELDPAQVEPSDELFFDHVHAEDLSRLKCGYQNALDTGGAFAADIRLQCGTQSKYAHFQCRTVEGAQYKAPFVLSTLQDISERIRMEETLHQSEKLQAIGELAGGIAHDFNNMLGGIMGATELLEPRLPPGDATSAKYHAMIMITVKRAAELTQKLLTFSRKQPFATTVIDLHSVINDAAGLLSSTIDRRVKLMMVLDAVDSMVSGDSALLQSAILNLGINAAHSMPDGGMILIRTCNEPFDPACCTQERVDMKPGRSVLLEVIDTGCGMSQEVQKRIFEPFYTTKKQGKGTGLGLAAVLGTVQQHHGAICVRSEVGQGSRFLIHLPVADSVPQVPARQSMPLAGSGLLLVVDDDEILRETARGILEQLGYDVLTAVNGKEGAAVFERHKDQIDLVILDMIMPVMNGRDCFRLLKAIKPNVRVLIASGFAQQEDVDALVAEGICGMIQKPFLAADLSERIHLARDTG